MGRVSLLLSIALGGPALLSAGCYDVQSQLADRCTIPLVTLTPHDTTVHVGDTLTVHASFTPAAATCLPGATLADLRWQDGSVRPAELHWYEATGIGRRELKIKRYLD